MTTAVEPSSHTIELRGLRLHYLDWGPELAGEAALPLVLLHGLGGAAGEWRRVAGHFQPRYVLDAETLQRMDMAIEPARSIGLEQSGHNTFFDMEEEFLAVASQFFAAHGD